MDTAARCIFIVVFAIMSFVSEMLYSSVKECNRVRIAGMGEEKKKKGIANIILSHYRIARTSLKAGKITFAILLLYTIYSLIRESYADLLTPALVSAGLAFLILIISSGYIAHSIARALADSVISSMSVIALFICIIVSPITLTAYALSYPPSLLLPKRAKESDNYTEEEFTDIIEKAEDEGTLEEEEREIIHSAISFGEELVSGAMKDIEDVFTVSSGLSRKELVERIAESGYSRVPICKDGKNVISGILRARDFLAALIGNENTDIRKYTVSPIYVTPESRLITVMNEMKKRRLHMAIVRDKERCVLGIITMEDILEKLVGDIYDEDDSEDGGKLSENTGGEEI